jgi:signal transduction histidine kinase
MLALGISGGAFLAHRALRPLHQLNDIVRTIIETGKIDARIPPQNTAGELNDLVLSFNQMLEKIDGLIQGMKGILDNVAHDLRTPITRLRGAAELALRNPLDTRSSQEALADCVEESERVVTLLNALMDISQVETGAMKLELKRVDVARIVAQILDLYREVAEENKITIFASVPEDIWIRADENRIRQAVGNLIDNAIKYTPPAGEIHIESRIENGELAFSVRDTGIGIATEELPCVWDRLYRGDKSRSQQGLGLGLSLVKAIVQAHAGHVAIESKPGSGSLFTLYLPAASAAPV